MNSAVKDIFSHLERAFPSASDISSVRTAYEALEKENKQAADDAQRFMTERDALITDNEALIKERDALQEKGVLYAGLVETLRQTIDQRDEWERKYNDLKASYYQPAPVETLLAAIEAWLTEDINGGDFHLFRDDRDELRAILNSSMGVRPAPFVECRGMQVPMMRDASPTTTLVKCQECGAVTDHYGAHATTPAPQTVQSVVGSVTMAGGISFNTPPRDFTLTAFRMDDGSWTVSSNQITICSELNAVQARDLERWSREGAKVEPQLGALSQPLSKEWCINAAQREGNAEVGVGFETIPMPPTPDLAALRDNAVRLFAQGWSREFVIAMETLIAAREVK